MFKRLISSSSKCHRSRQSQKRMCFLAINDTFLILKHIFCQLFHLSTLVSIFLLSYLFHTQKCSMQSKTLLYNDELLVFFPTQSAKFTFITVFYSAHNVASGALPPNFRKFRYKFIHLKDHCFKDFHFHCSNDDERSKKNNWYKFSGIDCKILTLLLLLIYFFIEIYFEM